MLPAWMLPACTLVVAGFAGCLGDASTAAIPTPDDATSPAAVGNLTELAWAGYLRVGVGDQFAHTRETEPLVDPIARMGFLLEVPEGATGLWFRLTWPAGEPMHLMMHGPEDSGMPTYMSDMGDWPTNGDICFGIPRAEVLPGTWKVMAHGEDTARDLSFRITTTLADAPAAAILEGAHGHPMSGTMMGMEMRATEPCP